MSMMIAAPQAQPTHSYTIYSSTLYLKPNTYCQKPVFKVACLPISNIEPNNLYVALLPGHIWQNIISYVGDEKLNMRLVCKAFAEPQWNSLYRDTPITLDRNIFNVLRAYPGIPFSNTSLKVTEAAINWMDVILNRFPELRSFSSLMIMKPEQLKALMEDKKYELLYPILITLIFFWLDKKLNKGHLQDLLHKAPLLTELRLNRIDEVSGLFSVFKGGELPALKSISLRSTNVTTLDITELLSVAPRLGEIDISDCQQIDFEALRTHLETLASPLDLTSIYLDLANITEAILIALIKAAPKLKKLDLTRCLQIDWDKFISLLPNSLPNIKSFFIPETRVSYANVKSLIQKCPNVKSITLWQETLVTAEEKTELEASYPHIRIN